MTTVSSSLSGTTSGTINIPDYSADIARIATALETIASNSTTIASNSTTITGLATGDGFHIIGPWEWLGFASIVKLLQDKGTDFAALKAAVESLPKSF